MSGFFLMKGVPIRIFAVLSVCCFLTGCGGGGLNLSTVVDGEENIGAGAAVFLDGEPVGAVSQIESLGEDDLVQFRVEKNDEIKLRLRRGLERIPSAKGIELSSSSIEGDAPELTNGERIPTRSLGDRILDQISVGRTLTIVALGLGVLLVMFLVLKSFFPFVTALISLVLAGVTALVIHPLMEPVVHDLYNTVEQFEDSRVPPVDGAPREEAVEEVVSQDEDPGAIRIIRPHPQVVAVLLTGIIAFVFWSCVIGFATRKLKGGGK